MKKLSLFALITLLGASCTQSNDELYLADNSPPFGEVETTHVTLAQAIENAARIFSDHESTRAFDRAVKSAELFVARPATRSVEGEEVSFYLINYEEGGFAMVSTDSRTTPVYAFSDTGELTTEDFSSNPGLDLYLDEAVATYEYELNTPTITLPEDGGWQVMPSNPITMLLIEEVDGVSYHVEYKDLTIQHGPFLVTEWGQDMPYNRLIAPDLVGCSPLAAGQIMAYHKHPASYGGHAFDWEAMTASPKFSSNSINQATYDISWLVWNIGKEAGTDYGSVSLTKTSRIDDGFEAFGYTVSDPANPSHERMLDRLGKGYPIWMRGENSDGAGHAWVVDGVQYYRKIKIYYSTEAPYKECFRNTSDPSEIYYHCNWGWYGGTNGFFYYPDIGGYANDMKCIHNITPNK